MILFAMKRAQMLCVFGESLRDAVDQPAPNDPAETQK
jgi:hypothetical protein